MNNIGQRSGVVTTGSAFVASSGWTWGYDVLGQVTSAAHTSNTALNQGYDYDDIGNRIQSTVGLASPAVTNYTANMLNQYSIITGASAPAVNPSYDADGNQLAGAAGQASGQTFEWDGENRLKVVKDSLGNVLVTYGYDAQSRRIRRMTSTGSTLYVYDAWNCVGEHTVPAASTTTTLSRTLAWGLDLSGSLQGAGGVGGLLSVVDVSGSTVAYPTYDGNGNVSEYLDATGAVVAHFEYDAFGKTVVATGATTGLDIRFSTKPQDEETGWNYYGYRFYDAVAGRWVSRDPSGESGGMNLYAADGNDFVIRIDVLGLATRKSLGYSPTPEKWRLAEKTGNIEWRTHGMEYNKSMSLQVTKFETAASGHTIKLGVKAGGDVAGKWLKAEGGYEYSIAWTSGKTLTKGKTDTLSLKYEIRTPWEERITYPTEWETYSEEWINHLMPAGKCDVGDVPMSGPTKLGSSACPYWQIVCAKPATRRKTSGVGLPQWFESEEKKYKLYRQGSEIVGETSDKKLLEKRISEDWSDSADAWNPFGL